MGLNDTVIAFVLGCFVGWFACKLYIQIRKINQNLDELNEHEDEEAVSEKPSFWGSKSPGFIAILAILALSLILADRNNTDIQENYAADEKSRCVGAVDTRTAMRGIVEAVYTLASGLLEREEDAPPLTEEEVIRTNAFIDRINTFREDTYDKIKPSKACAEYVKDDDVTPPTPSLPYVEYKE